MRNHGDHDALAYDGHNIDLAHLCQICGKPMPARTEEVGPVACVKVACANAGIELDPAQIDALAQELVDMGANFD